MRKQKKKMYARISTHLEHKRILVNYRQELTDRLYEFLAQITPDQLHGEIDFGPPVGKEILPPWEPNEKT
jgi:antitoxin component of MazEF toxin-antitoxin module